MSVLLEVTDLYKEYPLHGGVLGARRTVHAVNGISFTVHSGNSLGIAGESGCGKTTTARLVLKLLQPTAGVILFAGRDIAGLEGDELLAFRRQAQLVFQNPYEALNPRFTVLRALLEPLIIHRIGATAAQRVGKVTDALHRVHLNPPELFFLKYPHQLSGGQLQRVVIARALLTDPALLVADEPVSMLDVSIRAGVLNLMHEIEQERSSRVSTSRMISRCCGTCAPARRSCTSARFARSGRPRSSSSTPAIPTRRRWSQPSPTPTPKRRAARSVWQIPSRRRFIYRRAAPLRTGARRSWMSAATCGRRCSGSAASRWRATSTPTMRASLMTTCHQRRWHADAPPFGAGPAGPGDHPAAPARRTDGVQRDCREIPPRRRDRPQARRAAARRRTPAHCGRRDSLQSGDGGRVDHWAQRLPPEDVPGPRALAAVNPRALRGHHHRHVRLHH